VKKEIEEEVKNILFNSWRVVSGLASDGVVSSPNLVSSILLLLVSIASPNKEMLFKTVLLKLE
jgi:hypothetical protein